MFENVVQHDGIITIILVTSQILDIYFGPVWGNFIVGKWQEALDDIIASSELHYSGPGLILGKMLWKPSFQLLITSEPQELLMLECLWIESYGIQRAQKSLLNHTQMTPNEIHFLVKGGGYVVRIATC